MVYIQYWLLMNTSLVAHCFHLGASLAAWSNKCWDPAGPSRRCFGAAGRWRPAGQTAAVGNFQKMSKLWIWLFTTGAFLLKLILNVWNETNWLSLGRTPATRRRSQESQGQGPNFWPCRPTADEQGGSITKFWFPFSTSFWRVKTRAEPVLRTKQTNQNTTWLDRPSVGPPCLQCSQNAAVSLHGGLNRVASCVVRLKILKQSDIWMETTHSIHYKTNNSW